MKDRTLKQVLIFWSFVALMGILSIFSLGCKSKKPLVEKSTTIIDNSELSKVKDELRISKAINDSLNLYLGNIRTSKPECDSVCQEAVDRHMAGINSRKKSGGNEAGFYYNKYRKILTAYSKLEETVSQKRDSIHIKYEFLKLDILKPVLVEKELTWEQKISIWAGRLFLAGIFIYLIFRARKLIPV